ncbi:hypothetical protein ACMA1I_12045 [Pontibacter sp. 13R65]|uniref:hypothetical protein n=1 Tax=Pontibacter sp. 13R65 TaxID=3127458 RepID=UPI0039C947E1
MSKARYTVAYQDVSNTNALLDNAFIYFEDLLRASKGELCRELGVDALVSGKTTMSKSMSDGAAIAVGLLLGMGFYQLWEHFYNST